ncbi:MAG: 4-(cytidine 5'-diphospho)-2-C-methyl-D-erythritol kinase, partial [Bordetella sp. SCN 68-11]
MTAELRDVPAPAKINLFLHVVGRRPDGYHLLQTAFRFIDLQDTLHFRARSDGRIVRAYDLPGVAEDADLVVRAARALQQATGCRQGAEIGLEKRIPAGGGLGGGSSDAATVLLALNRLWGTGLSRRELMRLALPLGADVPVF